MMKRLFTIISFVPLGGLAFFYSFLIFLDSFRRPVSSWMSQNPEVVGGDFANWFFPALCVSTFILVLSLVYYLIARLTGAVSNFSSKDVVILLSTGLLQFLMMAYDPGGYIAWLFD
mgnify:CR=1 FL=1